MTSDLSAFIKDLSTDPRQYLTKTLLDAIAAVWKDETRLSGVTLDFSAASEFEAEEPIMTWFSLIKNARSDFAAFAEVHLTPRESAIELSPELELEFARMNLVDAEEGVAKAMRRVADAQQRLADAQRAAVDAE